MKSLVLHDEIPIQRGWCLRICIRHNNNSKQQTLQIILMSSLAGTSLKKKEFLEFREGVKLESLQKASSVKGILILFSLCFYRMGKKAPGLSYPLSIFIQQEKEHEKLGRN